MSKGLSYLAAYRMAQADQMNTAYKQALMEIQNDQARAQAYQDTITSIDKQIEAYEKLLQKVQEAPAGSKASKNEILDAEIALANVYSKNAGHSVSVYRYADENFDAPPRVSNEIQTLGQQRAPYYTAGQLGNLSTHLQKPEYANVFTDLSPQQSQDAAIKLYEQVQMEATSGLGRTLTATEKAQILQSISSTSGVAVADISRASHQQAKQTYIQNAIDQTQGSTARLEQAIADAKTAGPAQPSTTTPNLTNQEKAMVEAASVIAADGVIDNTDQAILFSVLGQLYPAAVQVDINGKTKRYNKFEEMPIEERAEFMKQNGLPSSVDDLFRQKIISQSPEVQEARQVGRINRNITILQEEREQLAIARSQAQQEMMQGLSPENLRERQAEIFAQTLSPEERKKYLTPDQIKRIEFLESNATTKAQRAQEAVAPDPFAGKSQDEINVMRAMAAAIAVRTENKQLKLNPTEEDSYRALADLVKNGSVAKQDIYNRSMQLANQMGGLPDARRSFAQSVASRIYLDLYDEQKALQVPEATSKKDAGVPHSTDVKDQKREGDPMNFDF